MRIPVQLPSRLPPPPLPSSARPRQERLTLAHSACLPAGFTLDESGGVLQLVREATGERLGVMSSRDLACEHAGALARIFGGLQS